MARWYVTIDEIIHLEDQQRYDLFKKHRISSDSNKRKVNEGVTIGPQL